VIGICSNHNMLVLLNNFRGRLLSAQIAVQTNPATSPTANTGYHSSVVGVGQLERNERRN
jgi:hypothetical protein